MRTFVLPVSLIANPVQTKYLQLCEKYLPDFPIAYIGFTTTYAHQFFQVPKVPFNMLQNSLMGPIGSAFIRKAKSLNRPIYAWTVNDEKKMKWCIKNGVQGIVTDDPEKSVAVCKAWNEADPSPSFGWREWFAIIRFQILTSLFYWVFRWRFGSGIDSSFLKRRLALARGKEVN
jgi:hypothetical protein